MKDGEADAVQEMDPFSIINPANLGLVRKLNSHDPAFLGGQHRWLYHPHGPCTICPSSLPFMAMQRSRLTPCAGAQLPRFVLSRVSAIAVTWWVPACTSSTVRQTPL